MTASLYDLQYTTPSPQERVRAQMLKVLQRKKSITPNKADGFLTTGTLADSEAEGDGQSVAATSAAGGVQN